MWPPWVCWLVEKRGWAQFNPLLQFLSPMYTGLHKAGARSSAASFNGFNLLKRSHFLIWHTYNIFNIFLTFFLLLFGTWRPLRIPSEVRFFLTSSFQRSGDFSLPLLSPPVSNTFQTGLYLSIRGPWPYYTLTNGELHDLRQSPLLTRKGP